MKLKTKMFKFLGLNEDEDIRAKQMGDFIAWSVLIGIMVASALIAYCGLTG